MTTEVAQSAAQDLRELGFVTLPDVLSPIECDAVIRAVEADGLAGAGSRNLLERPWCQTLAIRMKDNPGVGPLLPPHAVAVQCTLFEKSAADKNWLVALHQDLSIPVRGKVESGQCSGWSEKEGGLFVQPPAAVLESLVAVRVHLDECGVHNGPLRVVPGSHRHGRLSGVEAQQQRRDQGEHVCVNPRGRALLLKPLLLHSSSKSTTDAPRRVLHFLYGSRELPCQLQWRHAI